MRGTPECVSGWQSGAGWVRATGQQEREGKCGGGNGEAGARQSPHGPQASDGRRGRTPL